MSDDRLPPSSHFYAIIEAGRVECPQCGLILIFGAQAGSKKPDTRAWNPVSSTLSCTRCQGMYQLGIVAWPASRGRRKDSLPIPIDQQASIRQLAEVRQRAGGYFAQTRRRLVDDPANVRIPEECTCAPLPWSAGCPVHGGMQDKPVEPAK